MMTDECKQKVCRNKMSLSCRSGNGQLSVCACLRHIPSVSCFRAFISLHLSPTLLIALTPSPFLLLVSPPPPVSHSPHLFCFLFFLQSFSLCGPRSLSHTSSSSFFLIHPFFVNLEECSMWQALALWLFILVNLLRGEWLSSVPWLRLRSNKCVFSACDVYTLCVCACLCHRTLCS